MRIKLVRIWVNVGFRYLPPL